MEFSAKEILRMLLECGATVEVQRPEESPMEVGMFGGQTWYRPNGPGKEKWEVVFDQDTAENFAEMLNRRIKK